MRGPAGAFKYPLCSSSRRAYRFAAVCPGKLAGPGDAGVIPAVALLQMFVAITAGLSRYRQLRRPARRRAACARRPGGKLEFSHIELANHEVIDAEGAARETRWTPSMTRCAPHLAIVGGGHSELRSRLRSAAAIVVVRRRGQIVYGVSGTSSLLTTCIAIAPSSTIDSSTVDWR